jgi:hypothetical protein
MNNQPDTDPQETTAMSNKQKRKILDVMHTLMVIHEGRAHNPESSAKACWDVLQDVLDLEATNDTQS